MKNFQLSFLIFFAVVFIIFPQQAASQISPEAVQAFRSANIQILNQTLTPRDFSLPLLNGGNVSLSDYRGKVVILNFWATWCPPCRDEMPSMENLYQRFHDNGLEILAVDLGEDVRIVSQFIQFYGYTFPVLMDRSSRVGSLYGIASIPTSFIIDREGKIIARIVGSIQWDTARIIAAFDALLRS